MVGTKLKKNTVMVGYVEVIFTSYSWKMGFYLMSIKER